MKVQRVPRAAWKEALDTGAHRGACAGCGVTLTVLEPHRPANAQTKCARCVLAKNVSPPASTGEPQ